MIFLVDCSGSQSGAPIAKAKETLNYIVEHMNQNDTFQVLAFNDDVATLSAEPIKANAAEKLKAHAFINRLTAVGGTWMGPAVKRVLHQPGRENMDLERLRIVTFMTDGCVGNDLEIMEMIKKERGRSRWFSFGTGNSVNRTLIDNVARLGGGEADYVLLNSSAEEVGKKFYSRISSPALTDVKLEAEGVGLYDILPGSISDVWANKPLYFTARYKNAGHGKVVLKGFAQGKPYKQTLDVALPDNDTTNSAIEKIWAREKIDSLTDQDLAGLAAGEVRPQVQEAVTKVALAHRLMSPFTSFVAVESAAPSRAATHVVPVQNLQPDGVELEYGPLMVGVSGASADPAAAVSYAPSLQGATNGVIEQERPEGRSGATGYGSGPLQGTTNGTIGPQGSDSTYLEGVSTAGTVRINNLANLEALLNIMANAIEIGCIAWGGATMIIGFKEMAEREDDGMHRAFLGACVVLCGLAAPCLISWLVAIARDMYLFN
jgi:Ca-activated chloride channel family protein